MMILDSGLLFWATLYAPRRPQRNRIWPHTNRKPSATVRIIQPAAFRRQKYL